MERILRWYEKHAKRLPRRRPVSLYEVDYFLPDLCRGEGLLAVIVISLLLSVLMAVARFGIENFDWSGFGNIAFMAIWIALLSVLVLCECNRWLIGVRYTWSAVISFGLVLAVAFVVGVAADYVVAWSLGGVFGFGRALNVVVVTAIPAGILLRYLYLQQQLRIQQRAELEARIQALQARIRPHFLFNSMNMIASLIGSDPEKAERVVEDLSDLFRRALSDAQTLVPLREELALCRSYMAIEKMRLGDRLRTEWEIGDYGAGVQIPCLSLQPVLENAVYHGIQLLPAGGSVEIRVRRAGDRVTISVRNPFNPRMRHNKGSKSAMDNVRRRLEAHFGPRARVEFLTDGEHYVTTLSYPLAW